MKYCPYCGAVLIGGAASFCVECGSPLPSPTKLLESAPKPQPPVASKQKQPPPPTLKLFPFRKWRRCKPTSDSKGRNSSKRSGSHSIQQGMQSPDPRDEGYDGYYNDIKPIDSGYVHDRTEPELVKRIIIVTGGAFVIMIIAVILMNV